MAYVLFGFTQDNTNNYAYFLLKFVEMGRVLQSHKYANMQPLPINLYFSFFLKNLVQSYTYRKILKYINVFLGYVNVS